MIDELWESDEFKEEHNRWEKIKKMIFFGLLNDLAEDKVDKFLNKRGWNLDNFENEITDYFEKLFPELI